METPILHEARLEFQFVEICSNKITKGRKVSITRLLIFIEIIMVYM
jgi:hypothetical protein